jgi:thiol:disulfide interchange protein DsbC
MSSSSNFLKACGLLVAAVLSLNALADEAQIRKNLPGRLGLSKPIDEVSKTPIPGVYEVRVGTQVVYTDEQGDYLIQGSVTDTRNNTNLTQERIARLTAFEFEKLPFKDALVWKKGKGTRRMVVFADPFCSYCRHLETELQKVDDITVYVFLIPIISEDSPTMSRDIWCSNDRNQAWLDWMLQGKKPARSMGKCDTPMERNLALASKHQVRSTPEVVYSDSTRVPGAQPVAEIEKKLASLGRKS